MTVQPDPMFARKARPVPAYGATTGFSADGTSRDAAEANAASGRAGARMARILELVEQAGPFGLTYPEAMAATGLKQGQATSVLSNLHKAGQVCALADERRNGCGVYVLPRHVNLRTMRPFTGNSGRMTATERELVAQISDHLAGVVSDQPTILIRRASLSILVKALKRLDG